MGFTPEFLDDIRSRLSLAEIIARRVRLARRGREHVGLCPFHNEKTPSFTVSEEKGFFHCFGCGAHGDVIEFEMRTEGLSFPEAVERLAGMAGLSIPASSPEDRARARRQRSLYAVLEAACVWFQHQLRSSVGRAALDYLHGRGVDDTTIARFRLGFAPDSRTALKSALTRQGIDADSLIEAGLLRRPEDGEPYDYFRGRIIFPITDRRGRIIAFGGRAMGDVQPKYLNSPDTPLFQKGRVLYGHAQALRPAVERREAVVAEGYMDVIALHRAGYPFAVAPLGTALTEAQIAELWRMAPEPVLCFDGDAAGHRAAVRAAERALPMLRPGCSLRFLFLPQGEDPGSRIEREGRGGMSMLNHLDRTAVRLVDFLWRTELSDRPADTPERRAELERRLEERVRRIRDRSVQHHYRQEFRDRLWRMFGPRRDGGPGPARTPPPAARPRATGDGALLRQRILLALAVNHPALLQEEGEVLAGLEITAPELDRLRGELIKTAGLHPNLDSAGLKSHLRDRGFAEALEGLLSPNLYVHAPFARPDARPGTVRAGWRHLLDLYHRERVRAEIEEAERALANDMTDENFARFVARQTLIEGESGEAEGPDEDEESYVSIHEKGG